MLCLLLLMLFSGVSLFLSVCHVLAIHFLYLGFKLFIGETGFELYSYNVIHSRVGTSNVPAALIINDSM